MNKVNYQLELDKIIDSITADGITPTLLMHSCCAPCSSYCLSYLAEYFSITVLYYNPNISPKEEYDKRVQEQIRLIGELSLKNKVRFIEGNYEPERFYQMAEGMEHLPEGGERCARERRPDMQRNMGLTILQQHYRLVRIRMLKN